MDLYRETLMGHYKSPLNLGMLHNATHQATEFNPVCGDEVTISLEVKNGRLMQIKHQTTGCAIAIASASVLTEQLKTANTNQALAFTLGDLIELLGTPLTVTRRQCAQVALNALRKALKS